VAGVDAAVGRIVVSVSNQLAPGLQRLADASADPKAVPRLNELAECRAVDLSAPPCRQTACPTLWRTCWARDFNVFG
jgi:hypothetical protein